MIAGIVAGRPLASAPATLRTEILADSPAFYFRHADLSGTVATNEVGIAGTYSNVLLNQSPIYTGGPPSAQFNGTVQFTTIPASTLTSAPELSLVTVIKPTSTAGFGLIVCRDDGAGDRFWQWRANGTSLEWVKIVGGVEVVTAVGVLTADVACIIHTTIASDGSVAMYRDGVLVHSATIAAADYGDSDDVIAVGYTNGGAVGLNAYVSEVAGFAHVLSPSRVLAHAEAAEFA